MRNDLKGTSKLDGFTNEELMEILRQRPRNEYRAYVEAKLFEKLYEEVWRSLLRQFSRLSIEDLQEVASDALLRVLSRPAAFDPARGSLLTYVRAIAFRAALKRSVRREVLEMEPLEEATEVPAPVETREESPVLIVVRNAIERLPRRSRAVMELHARDCTYEEIAEYLKMTLEAVRTAVCRGLKNLRADLGEGLSPAA